MVGDGIPAPNWDSDPIPFYRSLLRSCALGHSPPSLGRQLHAALLKSALLLLPSLSAALFHMYAAAGPPSAALRAFRHLLPPSARSPVAWTALISSHAALPACALRFFLAMRRAAVPPDQVTLLALLSVSARLADPAAAAAAHLLFLKLGLPLSVPARNAAIDAYAKCGRMPDARRLFDEMPRPTVVSWTVLLSGALRWEGHASGREVFDRMPQKNEVSWTVMAASSIEAGLPREALSLLSQMLFSDVSVRNLNHISLCSLLSACSQAGDLTVGRWIHAHLTKTGLFDEGHLLMACTALVDMYAKCGRIGTARRLFEIMPRRSLVSWNAMLSGLSMHGMGAEVLKLFSRMVREEELRPDDITFVGVLSACSRSGLVEEGQKVFQELSTVYGLTPKMEHYACIVDLLGRAGRLEEAEALVREMPVPPNEVVLGSLLASCGHHGRRLELGRRLMEELAQMDPHSTEHHVLLSNMYASSGRHLEADHLRETMRRKGVRKAPAISSIQVDGRVHRFRAGDKSHPQAREVYAMLDEVVRRLRTAGYVVPDVASQISRVMDHCLQYGEEREQALLLHSEKLAVCFGLMSTRPGMPLRIFKNIRICADCHAAIKLISDIFGREIIVRDRNRFHSFQKGTCSCSDYW